MISSSKLSIIIPIYNAETTIDKLNSLINEFLKTKTFEIIYIDDRSTDDSWAKISKISRDSRHIKAIKLKSNYGQHSAILCGIKNSDGEFIITIDDDLQHHPKEILKLITHQQRTGLDLVYGHYKTYQNSCIRKIGSTLIKLTFYLLNKSYYYGSSFRLIKRKSINELLLTLNKGFFYLDGELNKLPLKIGHIEVKHEHTSKENSSYSTVNLIQLYLLLFIKYSPIFYTLLFATIQIGAILLSFVYFSAQITSIRGVILFTLYLVFSLFTVKAYLFYRIKRNTSMYEIDLIV